MLSLYSWLSKNFVPIPEFLFFFKSEQLMYSSFETGSHVGLADQKFAT